jgi:NTP pyrophosphatase (non-canonical NTP hydrolase)
MPEGGREMSSSIGVVQATVHALAREKGWWANCVEITPTDIAAKLALIHSEVSEALECVRDGQIALTLRDDGKPEGLPSELADIVIRVLDLAGGLGIDVEEAVVQKHGFNARRAYRHGGKAI